MYRHTSPHYEFQCLHFQLLEDHESAEALLDTLAS
jgi:hypothetical protein